MRPSEYIQLTKAPADQNARALNYVRGTIARAMAWAKFDLRAPEEIARERWGLGVAEVTKAAIGALTTDDVDESARAFFGLLAESTVLGRIPLRRWEFRVRTLDSTGVIGSEVGEGAALPIRVPSLSSFRLDERKFQAAVITTREALERGGEAAEVGLRDDLLRAVSDAVDAAFVGDLIAAADSNGFDGDHRYGVFLLHPSDAAANADLKLNVRGGEFRGYPCVTSNAVPVGSAILFDASRIAAAWTPGEIDFAQHATIEADDSPAQDSPTPTGPSGAFVSLFQTNTIAIRSTMFAGWRIGSSVEVVALGS